MMITIIRIKYISIYKKLKERKERERARKRERERKL